MGDDARIAELEAENARLQAELKERKKVARRAVASYQQRALQMEIIRQQNDDLDKLARELERARVEAEERASEVEQAARLKSEFLANFSHEIRTPLNGIIGYCDLLMREEGQRLTPHGRRDLSTVKKNAKTLLALINDILDLSKIEAGHVEVVEERFSLTTLVSECAATVRELLRGRDVELVVDVGSDAEHAFTDPLKTRQVILNLLSNAAKFTESGEILVEARAAGSTLALVVEDTGVGIPPDQLQHIFEKFRQVDGSRTRKAGGTGLGLAIVHELVRILGGRIDVESTPGRGTKFSITLPGVLENEGPEPETDRPGRGHRSSRPAARQEAEVPHVVLLIDDDPMLQQLVRKQLEPVGVEVQSAADGIAGLEAARELLPDAIILDIHLPRLTGWSVLSRLKSDPKTAEIPVVVLSVEDDRGRGFGLGAFEYLLKPVEEEVLIGAVKKAATPGLRDILVVDDDSQTRELLRRQLHDAGFRTNEASDGHEAMARIRISPPALMILDLMMPGLDGFEVLQRSRSEGLRFPVIVLTGKEITPEEESILRSGLARIIQKGGLSIQQVVEEAKQVVMERRRVVRARPRVLYVEDVEQNRDLVRRYLYPEFDLIEAEDGELGVERALSQLPDLILMDLSLPRLDGWEATKRIKASDPCRDTPIVALTAHAGKEDRERAAEAGCIDYLTKPIDRDQLVDTVRRHVRDRNA